MNTSCEVGVHADPVVLKIVCHHVSALKSCCHNHESRVAYLHLQDRLLYPDCRLFVESGDHKEGSITICSACSSTNEAFFLVVDSLRPKCKCYFVYLLFLWSAAVRLVYLERYRARQTGFFSRKSEWGSTLF